MPAVDKNTKKKGGKENHFGPYVLLYTIGEGEFAKVKYGIHSKSGEEAAIKLIRKENVGTEQRLSKIKREIAVLKVIETENYIGIVLEYASGGELFDYILAHRYLKEKEGSRLFAQLICGVRYLHDKNVIHRDLKLENLLLDRNKNIIITDFGFANTFNNDSDLMQTSCGSPCYAAPELVVSDGMYAGSAVDIWSCGVILYAILAGYLPYDDDPLNPEGDNINLLYKYILSSKLSFPDYIGSDARDLLRKMLVPDPNKRYTIKDIVSHRWLKPYKYLFDQQDMPKRVEPAKEENDHLGVDNTIQRNVMSSGNNNKRHTIDFPSNTQIPTSPQLKVELMVDSPNSVNKDSFITIESGAITEEDSLATVTPKTNNTTATSNNDILIEEVSTPRIMPMKKDDGLKSTSRVNDAPLDPFNSNSSIFTFSLDQAPINPFDPNASVLSFQHDTTTRSSTANTPLASTFNQHSNSSASRVGQIKEKKKSSHSKSKTEANVEFSSRNQAKARPISVQVLQGIKVQSPTTSTHQDTNRSNAKKALTNVLDPNSIPEHGDTSIKQPIRAATAGAIQTMTGPSTVKTEEADSSNNSTNTKKKMSDWIKRKSVLRTYAPTPTSSGLASNSMGIDTMNSQQQNGNRKLIIGTMRNTSGIQGSTGAVHWLRQHRGPVDQFALTSRPPNDIMLEVKACIKEMGFVVIKESEFKVKCLRPRKEGQSSSSGRRFMINGLKSIINKKSQSQSSFESKESSVPDSLYGDSAIDTFDEIRFNIELCCIKNFPNLFILDLKRLKGNVWAFKYLYHLILDRLELNKNGGYLNP